MIKQKNKINNFNKKKIINIPSQSIGKPQEIVIEKPQEIVIEKPMQYTLSGIYENKNDICLMNSHLKNIDAISIYTVYRENNYLYTTLNNINSIVTDNIPITLNIYLGNLISNDKITSDKMIEYNNLKININPFNSEFITTHPPKGLLWNASRALINYNGKNGILTLEDDIELNANFFKYANDIIDLIKKRSKKFIISFFNIFDNNINNDIMYIYNLYNCFSFCQAMYFSYEAANQYAMHSMNADFNTLFDNEIPFFCKKNNIELYRITKSLVQHIGKYSTGCSDDGSDYIYSKSYNKNNIFTDIKI